MSVDKTVDPSLLEKRERKYGEDPVIEARKEEQRKGRQKPAREYFENTLIKAVKIVHGFGLDEAGNPIIETYKKGEKDFESDGVFMANKLLLVYFLNDWYKDHQITIEDSNERTDGRMQLADCYWKYSLTKHHFVEVFHGAE